jgi:5-formyltetrahydrofolate cyclo-ligase
MTKAELRSYFLAKRMLLSVDDFEQRSKKLTQDFLDYVKVNCYEQVLLYWPIAEKKELDTREIIQNLLEERIKVGLPVCDFKTKSMDFFYYKPTIILEEKKYGLIEPCNAQIITNFSNTVVLVPLLAHNKNYFRVGYGGGFYDRFLALHPTLDTYGCAFFKPVAVIQDLDRNDLPLTQIAFI